MNARLEVTPNAGSHVLVPSTLDERIEALNRQYRWASEHITEALAIINEQQRKIEQLETTGNAP